MRTRAVLSIALRRGGAPRGRTAPRARRRRPETPNLPVAFSADELHLDTRSQALDATGDVRVDEPPFHLTSDSLQLRRVPIGVELDGEGKLAFCPCLGAPLAVRFTGATVAPPHDLILRNPVLEVFGVPVAWAPAFWLRSPGRIGLLPPDLAWRGADGFFAGGGVHLPWRQGDVAHGLDLRAGAYFDGGAAVDGMLGTTATETHVRWDDFRGNAGVAIAAHGATAIANADRADSVAWDIDALRGPRAVQATTDLDAAAKPFDRATAAGRLAPRRLGDRIAGSSGRASRQLRARRRRGGSRPRRPPRRCARERGGLRRDVRGRAGGRRWVRRHELRACRRRDARSGAPRRARGVPRAPRPRRRGRRRRPRRSRRGGPGSRRRRAPFGARVCVRRRRRSLGSSHRAAPGGRRGRGAHRRGARRPGG